MSIHYEIMLTKKMFHLTRHAAETQPAPVSLKMPPDLILPVCMRNDRLKERRQIERFIFLCMALPMSLRLRLYIETGPRINTG